jgi:hypothetical protein
MAGLSTTMVERVMCRSWSVSQVVLPPMPKMLAMAMTLAKLVMVVVEAVMEVIAAITPTVTESGLLTNLKLAVAARMTT